MAHVRRLAVLAGHVNRGAPPTTAGDAAAGTGAAQELALNGEGILEGAVPASVGIFDMECGH